MLFKIFFSGMDHSVGLISCIHRLSFFLVGFFVAVVVVVDGVIFLDATVVVDFFEAVVVFVDVVVVLSVLVFFLPDVLGM